MITTFVPLTNQFKNATYEVTLKLPSGLSPIVSVKCEYSTICAPYPKFKKITKNDQIKLKGKCSFGCFNKELTFYSYKMFKNDKLMDFDLNNIIWSEFPMNDNYFMGQLSENLTISSFLFQNYSTTTYWKAVLTITTTTNGLITNGSNLIIFKTNQVPFNGTCQVNKLEGLALSTNFTITCSNWFDADGYIYSYQFFGKLNLF